MKFLTGGEANLKTNEFKGTFASGAISTNHRVCQFFMMMQDRNEDVEGVESNIRLGRMVDFQTDWDEAERIIKTFKKGSK